MNLANRLTMLRIALVPVFLVVLYAGWPNEVAAQVAAATVFTLAALTDLFDGYVSRKRGEVTSFGKFMDPIADKMLVTAALVALVGMGRLHAVWVIIILTREFIVSGIRLVFANGGQVVAASWTAKIKTVLQDILVVILLIENFPFATIGIPMDDMLLAAAVLLTLYSGVEYVVRAWPLISRDMAGKGGGKAA